MDHLIARLENEIRNHNDNEDRYVRGFVFGIYFALTELKKEFDIVNINGKNVRVPKN